MGGTFSESKGHFITGNGSENQEEGPKNSHNHKKFTKISHNHKNGADLEGGYSFSSILGQLLRAKKSGKAQTGFIIGNIFDFWADWDGGYIWV